MRNMTVAIDELPYGGRVLRKGEEFQASDQHAQMLAGWGKAHYADEDEDADEDEGTDDAPVTRESGSYDNRQEQARPPGRKRKRNRKNQYDRRDMNTEGPTVVTSTEDMVSSTSED